MPRCCPSDKKSHYAHFVTRLCTFVTPLLLQRASRPSRVIPPSIFFAPQLLDSQHPFLSPISLFSRLFHLHSQIIMSNGLPLVPTSAGQKGRTLVTGCLREAGSPARTLRPYRPVEALGAKYNSPSCLNERAVALFSKKLLKRYNISRIFLSLHCQNE